MIECDDIPTKLPAHEIVYRQMREMVLFGHLIPGQPVTIQGLVEELDCGMTPVREALRRLTAEGALVATANRRVCVPELNSDQLSQLTFARNKVEPELAIRAAKLITPAQIEELQSIDDALDQAITNEDVAAYLRLNYQFHRHIHEVANAEILSSVAQALWLRIGPSLRIVCGQYGTLNLPDKHQETIDAMRAGDARAAGRAIRDDVEQGHGQLRRSLRQDNLIKFA